MIERFCLWYLNRLGWGFVAPKNRIHEPKDYIFSIEANSEIPKFVISINRNGGLPVETTA